MTDKCRCGLPVKAPEDIASWYPNVDPDPGPDVQAVVRVGEHPSLRRAIRAAHGWVERGALVVCHEIIPFEGGWLERGKPPRAMPWSQVGMCWCGTSHPVIKWEVFPCQRRGRLMLNDRQRVVNHRWTREEDIASIAHHGLADDMLARHTPGRDGWCTDIGCYERWPCELSKRAAEAQRLS